MYDVSASSRGDPVALSFVGSLRMRAHQCYHQSWFPPQLLAEAFYRACCQILNQVLPKRRLRSNPRVIRKSMSPYPTKYPNHSNWPQPSREAQDLIYAIGDGLSIEGIGLATRVALARAPHCPGESFSAIHLVARTAPWACGKLDLCFWHDYQVCIPRLHMDLRVIIRCQEVYLSLERGELNIQAGQL
jgi:hypothetical protein